MREEKSSACREGRRLQDVCAPQPSQGLPLPERPRADRSTVTKSLAPMRQADLSLQTLLTGATSVSQIWCHHSCQLWELTSAWDISRDGSEQPTSRFQIPPCVSLLTSGSASSSS